jgi:ferredoxin
MPRRKVIEIERGLCNGCGLCTTACAEGALALDAENKAVLLKEIYCDGLGACLDVCPTGALKVMERGSEAYDPAAAYEHVLSSRGREAASGVHGAAGHAAGGFPSPACGCPGSAAREIKKGTRPSAKNAGGAAARAESELSQWPIQLHLVSPLAPYFNGSDLLVAADCTAFSLGSFHRDLLKGKKLVIACPKLDDTAGYVEKLAEILKNNRIFSLTVAIMTVPCCSGLARMVERAAALSGAKVGARKVVIDVDGSIRPPAAE